MVTKYSKRVLDIIMNEFSNKTFSVCMMNAITGFVHNDLAKGVSFNYKVPENICRTYTLHNGTTRPHFSAAIIMALFDEISTHSCAMKDKNMRPGLSVHLSTELVKNMNAGDEVTILTRADKIGKTLGFCTMEIVSKEGELLARGKHIKHLPLGIVFDIITHPWIVPFTVRIYEYMHGRKGGPVAVDPSGRHHLKIPKSFPSIEGIGRVFDVLGLKRLKSDSAIKYTESAEANSKIICSDNGRVDPSTYACYGMTVQPITSNLRGTMHGGSVGCAVEHACLLSRTGNIDEDGALTGAQGNYDLECYVQGLEVRYISPMKGDLVITTADDIYAPQLISPSTGKKYSSRSIGKVLNKKDGSVCADYVCNWDLHKI